MVIVVLSHKRLSAFRVLVSVGAAAPTDFRKEWFVCLFVCNRGDTLECQDGLRTRKLGQSPINVSAI